MTSARLMATRAVSTCVHKCGVMRLVRPVTAGVGVILGFHEIQKDSTTELETGTTENFLDRALAWLKSNGWQIKTLDEGLKCLTQGEDQRLAIVTFDDGYRDIMTTALPILEAHGAPFTVFVPTGAPTRTLYSWWLGLRELFRTRDAVTIDAMQQEFDCPDLTTKITGMARTAEWIHGDLRRAALLDATFAAARISISDLNDAYFLSEDELKALAHHPLASIGGHTSSHAPLATLDSDSASCEVSDNRRYLEQLLQQPIRHFAYPYGTSQACGEREARIVEKCGYLSAVTTRHNVLTTHHRTDLFSLPRIFTNSNETIPSFDGRVSGLQTAMSKVAKYCGLPAGPS